MTKTLHTNLQGYKSCFAQYWLYILVVHHPQAFVRTKMSPGLCSLHSNHVEFADAEI